MDKQSYVSLACVIAGLFCCVCAGLNFDFFMNHRKAYFIVKIFGRSGARIFYVLIGLAFIAVGIGFYTGAIPQQGEPLIR